MKDLLKYSIWTGIYATLVVPFIVANDMFFPFIVGKAFTFRIIVEIIFGLWLILIIQDKEFRPKFSWLLSALTLFTFVLFIADLNAVAPLKAFWSNFERMEGFVTIAHLLAYFLVLGSMLTSKASFLWFLRANVFAGLMMAIVSLKDATEVRVAGPLGNPIYISIYFFFIFFFALILWYKDVLHKRLSTWIKAKPLFSNVLFYLYPAVALISLHLVYRTSRGVMLGVLAGLFITSLLIAIFEREKRVIRHISMGVIVAMFAVVSLFLASRDSDFVRSSPTLSRFAEISWDNVTGNARKYVWAMALEGFKEKPVLGWGQDGFSYVFSKNYDPRMYAQEQWFDRAHSAPLDTLVAGGILGFLAYMFIFGSAVYSIWSKRNELDIPARAIFTGIFAGYFFQALFVFDTLMSYIMFVTAIAYIHSRLVERESHHPVLTQDIHKDHQNYILIPLVLALTIASVWLINAKPIKANSSLRDALSWIDVGRLENGLIHFKKALAYDTFGSPEIREQLMDITTSIVRSPQVGNQMKTEYAIFTLTELQKQIDLTPGDARYYFFISSFLHGIGQQEEALYYIDQAIGLSPKKQTMRFHRVSILMSLGRFEEALVEAKYTYELDKNYDRAKEVYDIVLKEHASN